MSPGDVRGLAVHLASRILALAGDGEVYVSGSTYELLAGSRYAFEDRGEQELKGISGRRRVYALVRDAGLSGLAASPGPIHAQTDGVVVRSVSGERLSVDGDPSRRRPMRPGRTTILVLGAILAFGIRASAVSATSTPHEAHLTKDCSTYDGVAPSLCTVSASDLG